MSKKINLDQKIEYKGYWYLPSTPDIKVAGVVTYYPNEKITLELIGAFDSGIHALLSNKMEPIIYGKSSDAKPVSLIQCYQSLSLNFSAEFPIVRYTCHYMLVGKHIVSLDQKCQYKVQFRIPELSLWCHPAAIQSTFYSDKERQEIKKVCLSFNIDPQSTNGIITSVDVDKRITILLKKNINYDETVYRLNPQLEQYTYVEITRKDESSIVDLLSYIQMYEDFISLATLSKVKSSEITFYDSDLYQQYGKTKYCKPIHFIHPYFDRENIGGNKKQTYLFDYSTIENQYANILKSWFNSPCDLIPIRSHLIESLKKKKVYSSVDFLILIQAIEGFWWRFRENIYKHNNKSRKDNTHLNTIITELLNEFNDVELLAKESIDIEAIVDSRHYYSHFLPKTQKPKALDGIELFEESQKLRVLLICCILSFVGLDNTQINNIFQKSDFKL